ncbi:MAG: hypothetical protein ABI863_13675 [Ginsengibacter sp.]
MKQTAKTQIASFSKFILMLLAVIMMLATSCQKPHEHIKKTVPLTAEFQDSVTVIVQGSPGVLEQVRVNGWGSGTPIGTSTFEDDVKVDASVSPEIIKGVETITTANGDKIFATINGTSPDPDEQGNYEVFNKNTITGGTGKFAGATGSYSVTVKGNFNVLTENDTYAGTITY